MATKKISELTAISTVSDTDVLPIVDSSELETKKITGSQLKTYMQGDLNTRLTTVESDITTLTKYSTTEQVIGTWLGKPLYRKVYSISTINIGSDQEFDVSTLNISEISKIDGIITYQNKYQASLIMKTVTYYDLTNKKITVYIPDGESTIDNGKLVIEYTKTTD